MYAIVDIAGQQFKVEKDKKVFVHRLEGKEGSKVEFEKVLLIDNDKNVTVGTPAISGAMVTGKIIEHLKGDKVIVFKKKRRKGYKKKNGHRQAFTQIIIEDIIEKGAKAKTEEKKETPSAKQEEPVKEKKKVAPAQKNEPVSEKKETTAASKSATEKTAGTSATKSVKKETKKPAASTAKKTTTKKVAAKPAEKAKGSKPATASKTKAVKKPVSKKTEDKKEE